MKKEVKEVAEKAPKSIKEKNLLMTVESTGEKVVYSEKVHGKDYRDIARATAERFGGVLTDIE